MKTRALYIVLALCIIATIFAVGYKVSNDNALESEWVENREVVEIRVAYGDTLDEICYEYKPDWMYILEYREHILSLNGMDNCMLYAGQTLKVYACKEAE